MAESEGTVTGLDGDHVWVAVRRASACGNCDSACGSGLLAEAQGPKMYRVQNTDHARVGDAVVLTVPEGFVLRAAMLSYLLPVFLALLGALGGNAVAGDLGAILGMSLGLAAGVPLLRLLGGGKMAEPALSLRVKRHVISLQRNAGS